MISSQAVGRVKVYQSVVGGLLLLILPVAYLVLKLGGNPETVFVVHLIIAVMALVCRIVIIGRMVSFSFALYVRKVLLPISSVFILSACTSTILFCVMPSGGLLKTAIVIASTLFFTGSSILIVGISANERQLLWGKIIGLRHRSHE